MYFLLSSKDPQSGNKTCISDRENHPIFVVLGAFRERVVSFRILFIHTTALS